MTLRTSLLLLGASLAVLAASVIGYRTGRSMAEAPLPPAGGREDAGISVGPSDWLEIPAPDVPFLTLDGDTVRLSDHRGRVVLLNFWGTWCPPCRVEIPHLVETQKSLAEMGGIVVGPAIDSGSPEEIRRFVEENGINYPVWIGSDEMAVTRFAAPGYPFTLLIDREGVIRRTYIGPQTERRLLLDVATLLGTS